MPDIKDMLQRYSFPAMGSNANVICTGAGDPNTNRGAVQLAMAEVARIEKKYSRYLDDSIVARINRAAGIEWIECDAETLALLDYGAALHRSSQGLFDLTSGVLRKAWDFRSRQLPERVLLEQLLPLVSWDALLREGSRVKLAHVGMQLDFGGIGKEYAADRAATRLAELGLHSGFVNLAGDLAIFGPKPDGRPWSMAVPHPRNPQQTLVSLDVWQGGLATSGDYERYFELDGKRYCHVLHPRTGYPVDFWQSVTVLAPSASVAGSCSTIAMLLADQGLRFLEDSGLAFFAVDREGRTHQSS